MPRRKRSLMSEETKVKLAALQGQAHKVEGGYFGNLSSKDCGDFVKLAIQLAEQQLAARPL